MRSIPSIRDPHGLPPKKGKSLCCYFKMETEEHKKYPQTGIFYV